MSFRKISNALTGPGFFRIALAFIVFVYHVSRLGIGRSAVYIFFALSGYWTCVIWKRNFENHKDAYRIFILSRFWRLAPVFILCSIVTWGLIFLHLYGVPIPEKINWIQEYFSNIMIGGYNLLLFQANGPAWSLDIEMQFYLVSPLVFAAMRKGFWVLAIFCLMSLTAYFVGIRQIFLPYLAFFAIGAAAATFKWRPTTKLALITLTFSGMSVLICLASPYRGILLGGAHPPPLYVFNDLFNIIFAIAMVPWAIYTTGQKGCSLDRMFGDLSYIMYLLHWPVISALGVGDGSYGHRAVRIGESAIIVYSFSWIIWRWFDRPIDAIRSKWVAKALATNAASYPVVAE